MMAEVDSGNTERMSWWQMIRSCSGTELDRRNQYYFVVWLAAWGVTYVGATWVLETYESLWGTTAYLLALVPSIFFIGALFAYLRFLRMTDELIRRIQVEGLAIGFGAGVIFATAYQILERAGAPELEANTVVVVMMFGWVVGQLIGTWRYR